MSENLEQRASEFYEAPLSRGIKPFPDLIPGVGLITYIERVRRQISEPFVDFYLRGLINPKNVITNPLGTRNWPEPNSERERIRRGLHELVSILLTMYHVGGSYGIYRAVDYFF